MAGIRIAGRMVNFSRLTFDTNDLEQIRQELALILADDDYTGTLVILDSTVPQELIELIQLLIEFNLQPMAVVDGVLGDDARTIQFPIMSPDQPVQRITASSQVSSVQQDASAEDKVATKSYQKSNTAYHDDILRTGQSLVEEHGDVILNATMNSGAEIISSGNIYIYGTARGRIIAGASGQPDARIFCSSLEAELVSIAGTYCVADDIPKEYLKKSVQIHLNQQHELVFIPLSI